MTDIDLKKLPSPSDPENALATVVALRKLADSLERSTVIEAIDQGWTWARIAQALGVSRQAVHKKHAHATNPTKARKMNVQPT